MRHIILFALLALASAAIVPKFAGGIGLGPSANSVAKGRSEPFETTAVSPGNSRSVVISMDRRGHFAVDARVDGRRMTFMVDTGATVIALRRSDAARLGIHPAQRDFNVPVHTANGVTRTAPVTLDMVEVGNIVVRNVPATIMPDEALGENLLGLSFLKRLRRFEYREGRLVLEQ